MGRWGLAIHFVFEGLTVGIQHGGDGAEAALALQREGLPRLSMIPGAPTKHRYKLRSLWAYRGGIDIPLSSRINSRPAGTAAITGVIGTETYFADGRTSSLVNPTLSIAGESGTDRHYDYSVGLFPRTTRASINSGATAANGHDSIAGGLSPGQFLTAGPTMLAEKLQHGYVDANFKPTMTRASTLMPKFLAILMIVFGSATLAQSKSAKVERKEYNLESEGIKVWVYYPKSIISEKLPCVLIGAAGSRGFHGMNLVEGDSAEHYPYAEAGFAVVAYAISGPLEGEAAEDEQQFIAATKAFLKSKGGISNASAALAYASEKHSFIDPKRVYAVGHSSAGTVALSLAQESTGIRGCIAYAPVVDLKQKFGQAALRIFSDRDLNLEGYINDHSPMENIGKIKCPLFLFTAKDDSAVPPAALRLYVQKLQEAGKKPEYKEVETGEHYDSMIKEGIPAGIAWLKKLDKEFKP